MEVLNGNESEARPARRRHDPPEPADRSLDWSARASDILLLPHSPLALAEVLAHPEGCFRLQPQIDQELAGATPITMATPRKFQGQANLLSCHDASTLPERCRRLLVENALIKAEGDRRLLLAVGFLNLPAPGKTDQRYRAPLLLYPALLVRMPEHGGYEVRLNGVLPEPNLTLQAHCEQHLQLKLPVQESSASLRDYFGLIAELLNARDASLPRVELELDIALGGAALPAPQGRPVEAGRLPDIPNRFDATLAMSIAGKKSLSQLHAVLRLIPDFGTSGAAVTAQTASLTSAAAITKASVTSAREYAARLNGEGLGHLTFGTLATMPEQVTLWIKQTEAGLRSDTVSLQLKSLTLNARQLVRLGDIIELLDKAPVSMESHGHPDLCFTATMTLLQRARHQARLIEGELEALKEHFILDKVPGKQQLLALIDELGASVNEAEPDIVDADYFRARRSFMEFSVDKPAQITNEHRRHLAQLAKVLRFRELFVNNVEYRMALGPGYRGLRTDWTTLKQLSTYTAELSSVLESEELAARVVAALPGFRGAYHREIDTLQKAGHATRQLLQLGAARLQTRPLAELLTQSAATAEQLRGWQQHYGSFPQHADRSADKVLSIFAGAAHSAVVTEVQVEDACKRIAAYQQDADHSPQVVQETLKWLHEASEVASTQKLDISAIMDQLKIG